MPLPSYDELVGEEKLPSYEELTAAPQTTQAAPVVMAPTGAKTGVYRTAGTPAYEAAGRITPEEAGTPVVSIPRIPEQQGVLAQTGQEIVNQLATTAEGLLTPANIAVAPVAAVPFVRSLAGIIFGGEAMKDAAASMREAFQPETSFPKGVGLGTRALTDVLFGVGAAKLGATDLIPAEPSIVPKTPPVPETVQAPVEAPLVEPKTSLGETPTPQEVVTPSGQAEIQYRGHHVPLTVEGGASRLSDLTTAFGEDIYGPNARQYFGGVHSDEPTVLTILNNVRGKPNSEVTIYRGVPKDAPDTINAGDWVTLSKKYAAENGEKVISKTVKANDVTAWGDSLMENGYAPEAPPVSLAEQAPAGAGFQPKEQPERTGEITDASQITEPTSIPSEQVRPAVDESTPLRQQGEAPQARQEATTQEEVAPAAAVPPTERAAVGSETFKSKANAAAKISELLDTVKSSPKMMELVNRNGLTPNDLYTTVKSGNKWKIVATDEHLAASAKENTVPKSEVAAAVQPPEQVPTVEEPQTPTGIRNKIVDQEREARGLTPAMTEARRSFGDVWDQTLQKIDENPRVQDDLITELKQKPRALTDQEDAMLLHRQIDLQNQFDKASEGVIKAQESGDPVALTENRVRFAQLSDNLLDIYNVGRKAGTETARGLAARKMLANEDFSLAKMIQQKRAANEGRPLNESETDTIRSTQSKIADAQKTLDDYLAEREMQFAEKQETRKAASLKSSKTRLETQAGELEQRIAWQDLEKPTREPIQLDEQGVKLKANVERLKQQFQQELTKDMLSKRTPVEKFQDTFVKWRRGFVLSSPNVLAKLTSAAAQRMMFTPVEEAIGGAYAKLIPELGRKAPREGGFSTKAEAKAITEGFTKGMKDAWSVLSTGKSELDVLYGKRGYLPPEAIDFIGHIHGALKTIPKRAEFARSFQKRTESAIANGIDASDPLVQSRIAVEAYKDANRTIFLQDNRIVSFYKRALTALEQPEKSTGRPPLWSKSLATTARVLLPIVKVPTNIIAETMQYATGLATGSARLGRAFAQGIGTLTPEEAEIIARSLKKGTVGGALLALGYFNADKIGGYYQPGKRDKKDVKFGSIRVHGVNIPSYLVHNPGLEILQIGATIRRVADSKLKKSDEATQGLPTGILAAGLGVTEEVPFVREMLEVSKAFHPTERGAFIGELTKSLAVPQVVEWTARQMDKTSEGEVRRRKPEGIVEHIETGIPGLRQNVPEKTEKKSKAPKFE